ncbi:MAG: M4 family metallopeptidase, partial [Anaerolineaceae bacterium]|nr:M4 family metallopeptidase [Anaerolineaceae bacterium]
EYVADAGEGFSYAIQAQLITSDGIPMNAPIMISGPDGSVRQNPAVAYNSTAGEFLVIWDQEYAPTDHDIYVQRVNTAGELVGSVISVDYTIADDSLPDLVYNPVSGEYLAVWERYHTEQSEVYAQRLDGSGNPVSGGGFYVADDSMDESGAAVEFNAGTGEFMVVYHIQSASDNYDIYGQRVSSIGSLSGGLIQISTASGHQLQPQLGYNAETEQFLVVWQDARTTQDIYGQFVDGAGALTGGNFAIANEGSNYRNNPQIAYQPNGKEYMVTWSMNAPGEDVNIYYRRVSGDGSFPELEVLTSGEATLEEQPSIAAGNGLNYLLTWQDSRDTLQQENIYGEVIALPAINTCGGVFIPVADSTAYQDDPITTHGDDDILQVKHAAESGTGQAFTYMEFDLGERIPAEVIIHSAELELTLSQAPAPADFELQIVGSPQAWDEESLTWGNQPEWMQSFDPKSYHPVWSETEPVTLRMDVSTLVNLWTTDVFTPTGLAILPGEFPMDLRFYSSESLTFKPRLVVHCSPPVAFLPQSYEDLNAGQLVGIERLASQSSIPLTIHLGETGAVSYGLFDIVVPSEMTDALSRATWFTEAYADLLRLSDPGQDLQFVRYSEDEADLFFRQRYAGIPVLGSEIGIHLVGEHITGLSGSYLSDLQINPTPNITAERAREIALAIVDPRANVISDDQLRFLNRNLFGAEEGRTFLAWLVVLDVEGGTEYYIDANTGALRFFQPRALSGFDLDIETGNNHSATSNYCHMWWWTTDDDHWCDEGGCNGDADAEGISAYNNAKKLYSFWKNYLNRDSYDDDGSEIEIYIHVGSNWTNAHYVCDRFEFGDNYSVLDIMGHEFTHAVTDNTSDLVYKNESGALNESFSDIFGAFLDYGDWLIGEDLPGGAIRSMADPTLYSDPDRYNSPFKVPAGTAWDNGGVHVNSGINNHAAYLITEGGSFNGVNIPTGGIGMMR